MVTQHYVWWDRLVDDLATELLLHKSVGSIEDYGMQMQHRHHQVFAVWIRVRNFELHFAVFPNTLEGVYPNIQYAENNAIGYVWSIKDQVTAEELCLEMFCCIADREEIHASEAECLGRIHSYGYSNAYAASLQEDLHGVDVYIPYKGILVPLQLKQSAKGQSEHKRYHPQIPSLVYSNYQCDQMVERSCIERILYDYANGYIAHLNVHIANI